MEREQIRVVAAELEQDGLFLITQRRAGAIFPNLWEFPSGRVEAGESDEEALRRELIERLDAEIEVGDVSLFIHHDYEGYSIDFCVYRCRLLSSENEIRALRVQQWRWVPVQEMGNYDFPPADAESIRLLLERSEEAQEGGGGAP